MMTTMKSPSITLRSLILIHVVLFQHVSGFSASPSRSGSPPPPPPKEKSKPNILSFGNACVDLLAICDHFPVPDEKMHSSELLYEGGGNAANTACAIGRLSEYCSVHVAAAIGSDDYGTRIVEGLAANNVGVEYVERINGSNSPFSYILVTPEPDNARTIIHQPAARDMTVDFADDMDVTPFTAVHFDGRHAEAAVRLSEKLVRAGIPYSVDVERPRGRHHAQLLKGASLIICSSDYCNKVLGPPKREPIGDQERVDRLRRVAQTQAPNAVLAVQTIGSQGSYLIRLKGDTDLDDDFQDFTSSTGETTSTTEGAIQKEEDNRGETTQNDEPTVSVHNGALWCSTWGGIDVVDSTGAGDAYQGGFIAALWSFMEQQQQQHGQTAAVSGAAKSLGRVPAEALARAMRIGTRVSAKKLESLGARTGLPYASRDAALRREFRRLHAVIVKEQQARVSTA